jgi:hypothetical protein
MRVRRDAAAHALDGAGQRAERVVRGIDHSAGAGGVLDHDREDRLVSERLRNWSAGAVLELDLLIRCGRVHPHATATVGVLRPRSAGPEPGDAGELGHRQNLVVAGIIVEGAARGGRKRHAAGHVGRVVPLEEIGGLRGVNSIPERVERRRRRELVEDPLHDTVEERDVGTRADAYVQVRQLSRARLAGVDHDDLRIAPEAFSVARSVVVEVVLRGVDVRHARWVVLRRVRSDHEHRAGVADVHPMVRHRASSE